jgi:hypothetical protein
MSPHLFWRYENMCNSFKNWMLEQFDRIQLADIANHGANNGFCGLVYTSELRELYTKYEEEIWDMLEEEADALGEESALSMISHFNGAKGVNNPASFESLLMYYAAEKIAYDATQGEYEYDTSEQEDENLEGELA